MKLWSCMFVGAGILASTLAWFQQPDGPSGPPRRGDERGDVQREGRPPKNPIMEALDPDHDHVISAEEIKAATSALKKLDTNGDGKLTEDEFRPERAGLQEGRPPREGGGPPARGEQHRPDDNAGGPEGEFGPPRGPQGGPPSPERLVDHAFEFARLESSFQQQSQFTADASHELRTPISILLSHCELALNRPRSAEEYQQTIATCQTAAGRMKVLVDSLLTLARADAGKLELEWADIDLQQLAAEAVAMFAPNALERKVEIEYVGNAAPCRGDSARISQVIANLIQNAILHNRRAGTVTVKTCVADGFAILQVHDTGRGIPLDAQPHLFDRFYRVDEARSRSESNRQEGSGLGLAICKSIVDAHGGSLSVTSKLNEGSLFEMKLRLKT